MTQIELLWQIGLMAILALSAIKDIKTLTIPLIPILIFIIARIAYLTVTGNNIEYFLPALIIFIAFFAFALFTSMGGGDAIVSGMIGLGIGMYGLYAVMAGCGLAIIFLAARGIKKENYQEYPFVPFLLLGTIGMEFSYIGGNP